MKGNFIALILLAGSSLFAATHVSIGFGTGVPAYYGYGYYAPPPPPVAVYAPPAHAYYCPNYTWIAGYWYPAAGRYLWRPGYWAHPPFHGAYWVAPRYYGHRYYRGYWRR